MVWSIGQGFDSGELKGSGKLLSLWQQAIKASIELNIMIFYLNYQFDFTRLASLRFKSSSLRTIYRSLYQWYHGTYRYPR
jgi:hypothetical protein